MASPGRSLIRAWLALAVVDFIWACVLSVGFYGSTFAKLWQGVASTVLGKGAYDGGARTVAIGLLMHVCVAFFWSALFFLLTRRWPAIRRAISSPVGALAVAAVYGPLIWMAMSLLVIPALLHRPPTITWRWWVQLIGHAAFVGPPIVFSLRSGSDRS